MQDQLQTIDDLLDQREIKKAEVVIAKALRNNPPRNYKMQVLAYRARTRLLGARPDDALADLRAIRSMLGDEPEIPAMFELRGDCHFARFELSTAGFADRNDTAAALEAYQQIVDNHPEYDNLGWVYYQIGRILLTHNDVEAATDYFREGLLNPSHVKALTAYCFERLAFVSFYEARIQHKALGFINKAIDTYPPSAERRWLVQAHVLRSRILRDMHRPGEALAAAETALSTIPGSNSENKIVMAETLLTIGELMSEMGGHERNVINYLQQFIQLSKKPLGVDVTWSRVHEMLGDSFFKTAQYGSAAGAYQSALDFNPYHPWEVSLHFRIARSFYHQGDYERTVLSIKRMEDAAQSEGETMTDYRVYDVLGHALFALKRYDEAIRAYRTALHIAPPNANDLDKIKTYHNYAQQLSQPM
jgi:tetratricopeptide (TPR) repeat protein